MRFSCTTLAALTVALLITSAAHAATISTSTPEIGLGTQTIELTLDPEGVRTGAWLVVLGGDGIDIDAISTVVPANTDCFGIAAASSFDGQCAASPLATAAIVAELTITAREVGGRLGVVRGNITDFDSFEDIPIRAETFLRVVPEPSGALLLASGVCLLARRSRRRPGSA